MASPVDTSVKFFNESFPGAPELSGTAGALVSLLDACLCTGFGLRAATSVTVSGGVATVTLEPNAKNPNLLHSVILVEGITGAFTVLNGEQKVTIASATALAFNTSAADGTAAGTISVKTAPAGWEKKFASTNKAVFKTLDPAGYGSCLQVTDTGTVTAYVRAYSAMTDVDTGSDPTPTVAQYANGLVWAKSAQDNTTSVRWDFFADGLAFYNCPVPSSGAQPTFCGQASYFFGEILPFRSIDAFATCLSGETSTPVSAMGAGNSFINVQVLGAYRIMRGYTGLGAAVPYFSTPYVGSESPSYSGNDSTMGLFPSPTDGAMRLSQMRVSEGAARGASTILRGEMPGVFFVPHADLWQHFKRGDTVFSEGRTLYVVFASTATSETEGAVAGRGLVDISGPWR